MNYYFGELPIGTVFEYFGRRFRKEALSVSQELQPEGRRWAHVMMGETIVTVEGELAERLPFDPNRVTVPDWRKAVAGQWSDD